MRILVTGAAGFIGSAFCRLLFGQANKKYMVGPVEAVVGLDALKIGSDIRSLDTLKVEKNFTFLEGDICKEMLVQNIVDDFKITHIVNFAAESHVDRSIDSSLAFVQSNVVGVTTILEVIKKFPIRLLQVSTDEVYGELGDTGSFVESTPLAPNSPYSASKAAADFFVRAFVRTHGLDALITRCSNNYGPYQHREKFIPTAAYAALADKEIPIYGEGKNVRDWIFVEDHAWGIYLALTKGKKGEVYNLGSQNEMKNIDLAKKILLTLGKSEKLLKFVEDRKGHDWRYQIDSSKAHKELAWAPQWSFDEGLKFTLDWYTKHRE